MLGTQSIGGRRCYLRFSGEISTVWLSRLMIIFLVAVQSSFLTGCKQGSRNCQYIFKCCRLTILGPAALLSTFLS